VGSVGAVRCSYNLNLKGLFSISSGPPFDAKPWLATAMREYSHATAEQAIRTATISTKPLVNIL